MSAVLDIYEALSELSITAGGKTPQVFGLSETPQKVDTAQLPARLVLSFVGRGGGEQGQFIALGTLAQTTWKYTELLLWCPVAQGLGIKSVQLALIEYAGAFVEALRTIRAPSTQSHIIGWRVTPGVYESPAGGSYFGVECEVDIEEVLSS